MKVKSRNRRIFRILIEAILALFFLINWIENKDSDFLIISMLFWFVVFLEYFVYVRTYLELTDEYLKIKRKGILNIINEEYKIELKNIQSTIYKKKTYNFWELYKRLLWELFFPSGQSFLIINQLNGKQNKIPFDGNETELMELKHRLPESLPNQ